MNFDGVRPKPQVAKTPNTNTVKEPALLTWKAKDFERNLSGKKVAVFFFIVALLIAYSVWQADWFVIGIVVAVTAVTTWYFIASKPQETIYTISAMGIYVGERFYPFSEIHSFWLVYNKVVQELFIAFDRKYLPALSINIKDIDPIELKNILLRKIPEQSKRREALIDKAVRFLGL